MLLTSEHVISGNTTVELWDDVGNKFTGTVIASDAPRDLALIRINPGATEICDGQDNNCDGNVDEGFPDSDGDGLADCVDSTP